MEGVGPILSAIAKAVFDRGATDDDAIDRLNHTAMYGLLLVLAVLTGGKQFVGTPIFCWIPAQYNEKHFKKYTNHYCWIQPMYKVDFEDPIPLAEEERFANDISFYRWAPVFFVLLAVLFRLPHHIWKGLKSFSGANLEKLVGMTLDTSMMEPEERDEQLGHVAEFLHRWLTTRSISYGKGPIAHMRRLVSNFIICFGKRSGHNLVTTYIFIKLLYLLNVIMQLVIISQFLKTNFWSYGTDALSYFAEEGVWEDQFLFPRVALCDFKIRQMTNILTYTVQCVLTINLFLEKMFLILWFCLIFMLVANAISLLRWVYELVVQTKTTKFLMKYAGSVVPGVVYKSQEMKDFKRMVNKYLKSDGVFLLKMISTNTTDILVVDLLRQIWKRYTEYMKALGNGTGNSVADDEEK